MVDSGRLVATLGAGFAAMMNGFSLSWTSPTLTSITSDFSLDDLQSSTYSGCLPFAAAIGAGIAGLFIRYYGPYRGQLVASVFVTVGWVIQALAQTYWVILIGRLITGLSVGATTVCTPLFLNDIATKGRESAFGFVLLGSAHLGILLINVLGLAVQEWRHLAWISAAISCLAVFALACTKTPPRPGRITKKKEMGNHANRVDSSTKTIWAPYIISYSLMVFQQLSGYVMVIFFIGPLVDIADIGRPDIIAVYAMLIQLIATVVAAPIIDRVGKQILLFVSSFGMMTANIMLASFFFIQDERLFTGSLGDGRTDDIEVHTSGLALAGIAIFMASFNFGLGPIAWSVVGEYFEPTNFGSASSSILTWLLAFAVAQSASPTLQAFGGGPTYMAYAIFMFIGCLFTLFIFPRLQRMVEMSQREPDEECPSSLSSEKKRIDGTDSTTTDVYSE
eukprot:Clim_evm65s199 gene=Clim_evmTU65s199